MPLDKFSIDGAGLHIENYIYMYHLQEFIVLPSFVDSVQENFQINWSPQDILGRSAPIYSFKNAGPRTLQVTFTLHRDMMWQINHNVSTAQLALGDDYVDTLIKDLQACVLPDYDSTSKAVNPPIIAMRIGNDIFIKGIITGSLGYTWNYPILENGKYSNISISFMVSEIDPYDARLVRRVGSYRNISTDLDYSNIYDIIDSPEQQEMEREWQRIPYNFREFVSRLKAALPTLRINEEQMNNYWNAYLQDPENWNLPDPTSGMTFTPGLTTVQNQVRTTGTGNETDPREDNSSTAPQGISQSGAGQNTNEVQ